VTSENELWDRRRRQLEEALRKAAADLLDHMNGVNRLSVLDLERGIRIGVAPEGHAELTVPTP
jgi:hypothetical protein